MAEKGQGIRKGVGNVSELVGVFVGTAASTGKKIIVVGGKGIAGIGRSLLSIGRKGAARTTGKTTKAIGPSDVEKSEFFSLESVSQHNADMETRAKELEFELVDAQKELDQARDKAMKAQSRLASQMSILQREMMSPFFDLKNIQAKRLSSRTPDPALRHDADIEARAKKLESELTEEKKDRSNLLSQLNALQKERESIIKDLNDARDEVNDARNRIRDIESAMDEAPPSHVPSNLPEVTPSDVRKAVFAIEAERELVQRALSDIADGNEETRSEAAEALGSIHHELAVRVLSDRLQHEQSERVRAECVGALAALGMKEGFPAVERTLTDPAACVRLAAVKGVYRLAGTESVPMLMSALSDENDSVRYRAGVLTGWLGRHDMAVEMRKLLKNQIQDSAHVGGHQMEEGMETAL